MEEYMYFNGINGASGDYELPPMTPHQLAAIITGEEIDRGLLNELKQRRLAHWAVKEGVDAQDLAQSGWGVIFAAKDEQVPAIREALSELLTLRQQQAGERYREYSAVDGYRPGESKNDFLARHGAGPGPVDPDRVPYYLLIVGDPETIPYRFQNQLDVQYAVGRICFDTLEEYACYARSVVEAETGKVALPRRATFFGARTPGDRATELSADHMVRPLAQKLSADQPDWKVQSLIGEAATKGQLSSLLGGERTPALVYAACHGMGFPNGDRRQLPHQGALLCQDWPGPERHRGPIPENFYLSADDIASDAHLLGSMAFFFACYGAGTPRVDEFARRVPGGRAEIAPYAFVSRLPRRLLSHPKGGMLAVVGHVERAWSYSFLWERAGEQLAVFESTLRRLMEGARVGWAVEYFNDRYAEIASDLSVLIEEKEFGAQVDELTLAALWTANNDARAYVIIGDPAVRLPLARPGEEPPARPEIAHVPVLSTPAASKAPAPTAPAPEKGVEIAFGLRDEWEGLGNSIKKFTTQLATALGDAATQIATLEVKTYSAGDLEAVARGADDQPRRLRAYTKIAFDGDMEIYVPEKDGEVDQVLWRIHTDMVREAQANRAQFFRTMGELAVGLLKSLKL